MALGAFRVKNGTDKARETGAQNEKVRPRPPISFETQFFSR